MDIKHAVNPDVEDINVFNGNMGINWDADELHRTNHKVSFIIVILS